MCTLSSSPSSLNECFYTRPCLLLLVYDILLRFRLQKIVLISDINQAFWMPEYEKKIAIIFVFYDLRICVWKSSNNCLSVFMCCVWTIFFAIFVKYYPSKYFSKWKYFVDKCLRDLYVNGMASRFHTVFAAYNFYLKAKSILHGCRIWSSKMGLKFLRINE